MKTNHSNFLPYADQIEDGFVYDGDYIELNAIEEYGNDEYNFYPDASF